MLSVPYPAPSKEIEYIYMLIDPRNQQPFYVGRTVNPNTRLYQHTQESLNAVNPSVQSKQFIIKSIVQAGFDPTLQVIEITLRKYASERELWWWEAFIERGYKMANAQKPNLITYSPKPRITTPVKPIPQTDNDLGDLTDIEKLMVKFHRENDRQRMVYLMLALSEGEVELKETIEWGVKYIYKGGRAS